MDDDSLSGSFECTQSHIHNLPNWLKKKLNQVAPIILGKQAKYPLEFWHKIVGLPNNGCLLEDVPISIVSSSEIFELFHFPKHDSFKKLSISHLKNDVQAKKFVEWHNKVYCCQPYDGELCQCFVRAYLAHFGGRINVNWARTAYEYYKRLQEQAAKKDPQLIQVPIPALDEQLLALKNLFIEMTLNPVSFTQPNLFCCYNLDQSNKKEFTNMICSNFAKKEMRKKLIQGEKNPNLLLTSNNSSILQENDNSMLQKSFNIQFYEQQLESESINMSKTKNLIKPNVFSNDIHKDLCLTGNKQAMISQQSHGFAKDLSNENAYNGLQSLTMNDHTRSTGLFTLGFVKTHEDDLRDTFGSIVDELIEISTSESEEVSTQRMFVENEIFSPKTCIGQQCLNTNCARSQVSSSTQINRMEYDVVASNLYAFPHFTHENSSTENSSTKPQNYIKDKDENFSCISKLADCKQEKNMKMKSMIPQSNENDHKFLNENFKLRKSNNHSNVSLPHKNENLMKPKQRIGISILIQKFGEHNNSISIKEGKKNHQTRHCDPQQDTTYFSIIEEPINVQKPLESFRNNNLDSSRTATTISPPHEKKPLLIDAREKNNDINIEGNNYASESHNLTIDDTINKRFQENIISTTCSSVTCENCNCNPINLVSLNNEVPNGDKFKVFKENSNYMLEWSKESNSIHEIKMSSIQENMENRKEDFTLNMSTMAPEYIDSIHNAKASQLNLKINLPLHFTSSNIMKTIVATNDINKNTPKNFIGLEVPPLCLDKVVCQNNKSLREIEEIHTLNAMSGQLDSERIEISARSLSTYSLQRNDTYFPYCTELANTQNIMPFTDKQVTNKAQKQHFCATLVHHVENCNVNLEDNLCKSSSSPNSRIKKSKMIEDLNIQYKQYVCQACKDDSVKCKNMEEIFDINNVQKPPQVFKECNKSIKQCGTTPCIEPKSEVDMSYAIRSRAPLMKCAQAEYILEKKKRALAMEKTIVEDLIQKGDSQHALNKQLILISTSKLEAYNLLCSKVQNLALKISKDEDNRSQLSLYRKEKRHKEDMIEVLQKEIAELHKVHKDVQVQLDMSNCMLVESLMAVDNLTLDVEKAQKEVEQIIKEECLDQRSVSCSYLIPMSMSFILTSYMIDKYNCIMLKYNFMT
jgi:hypothetical protein